MNGQNIYRLYTINMENTKPKLFKEDKNMSTIQLFKDTKIPHIYSTGLYNELGFDVSWEHANKILDTLFTGVTECLADIKSKEFPNVFKFTEPNGEFIAAAVVEYVPNEDTSKPGNWSYSWTFYEEDLPGEGSREINAYDPQFLSYFSVYGHTKWKMIFEQSSYAGDMFRYMLSVIKKWLNDNASEAEENGVKLEGVVQFRVAVEDGKKVLAIEPEGEIKQLIKDDAAIEV